jgi:hypothetical protein
MCGVIPWDDIDKRLTGIGKDRTWLAENTPYSAGHIRTVLAPGSVRRSDRIQSVLSKAIEDEESCQRAKVELPPGMHELWLTPEELHRADMAARIAQAPSLTAFCRDAIQLKAREIIAREAGKHSLPHAGNTSDHVSPRAKETDAMAG